MMKTAAMTQAEQAQLDAVLRAIQTMSDKHHEFEAAMRAGDEQAVRAALQACAEADRAWMRTPSDFEDGSPADVARYAALDEIDALATALIPWDPENRGATVLAAEVSEIAAASDAMGAAYELVTEIDEELEYLEGTIELLRDMLGLFDDEEGCECEDCIREPDELDDETRVEYEARLARDERRFVELTMERAAKLGAGGEDPLGYWGLLAKHGLMIPEWHAIHSYQQRMQQPSAVV
ncbi:hypothetical protein [Leucobacter ruminantium]|uniref:Uncharacterized protein n=1 Tax=Leucobacter ruminantium TaxID=1289170 RepID=A0A939M070_9MICO|nr:hypothetical protein [Leucobacter ruminantium]MBO1806143.1 hypothetical protein [Leucobacter ruminantium]